MFRAKPCTRALILIACLLCGGCVTKTVGDSGTSIQYVWWGAFGVLALCLAPIVIGIGLRPKMKWPRIGFIVGGLVATVFIAPVGFLERVLVDGKGFSVHSGIWGKTANHEIAFDKLRSIAIGQEDTGGKSSRRIEVLIMTGKDGSIERFPLNNDVKIEGAKAIIKQAAARQIPIGNIQ